MDPSGELRRLVVQYLDARRGSRRWTRSQALVAAAWLLVLGRIGVAEVLAIVELNREDRLVSASEVRRAAGLGSKARGVRPPSNELRVLRIYRVLAKDCSQVFAPDKRDGLRGDLGRVVRDVREMLLGPKS